MNLIMIDTKTANILEPGTEVTDFRGDPQILVRADRAQSPGKSGKVILAAPGTSEPTEAGAPQRSGRAYYDKVVDVAVLDVDDAGQWLAGTLPQDVIETFRAEQAKAGVIMPPAISKNLSFLTNTKRR